MTKAERLADALKLHATKPLGNWTGKVEEATEAAAELRRLSAANAELRQELKNLYKAYVMEANDPRLRDTRAVLTKHGEPK